MYAVVTVYVNTSGTMHAFPLITMKGQESMSKTHNNNIIFNHITILHGIDFRFLTSRLRLMELWLFRGLFYSFVGFGTVCASDPDAHSFYANAIGVLMCILGLGYACMVSLRNSGVYVWILKAMCGCSVGNVLSSQRAQRAIADSKPQPRSVSQSIHRNHQ